MKIVVAITGASGVVLGERLLENLKEHECYTILSESAKRICRYEGVSIEKIKNLSKKFYSEDEIDTDIASSSSTVEIDAMVIIPCSMKTLSAIANGLCNNLITRCAENILKFNQKLILVPRDTPISLSAIENLWKVRVAGGIILPPNMAYYYKPKSIDDVTNFFVGKVLDALNIDHTLYKKWVMKDKNEP